MLKKHLATGISFTETEAAKNLRENLPHNQWEYNTQKK